MDISVDTEALDQLNTADARALYETTVKLSACGVGRIVDLPRIIVVGEQSSGKSSVLEAISRVRFPVQDGVCTRFATELVLRHADETRVDISVKFADSSKSAKPFQKTGFRENDLPGLIQEAKELMGYSPDSRNFSKDVLRLEIEGPNMYPLTLVDLPGLFSTETEDQTLEGMEIVNELVESYMRQKNSIILAVITANKELANHSALTKVKEHDPSRERTIGVITKPDLNRPGFAGERNYMRVARNEEGAHILKLGWHVLRNRAEDEPDLDKRDAIEDAYFSSGAWNTVAPEDRGVANLRKKLSKVLFRHIGNSLPGVVDEIERKHEERREELERLGKSRDTVEKKRSFLIDVANKFQRLARDGTEGRYKHAFFGGMDKGDRKLRAQLRNFNRAFDYILTAKGSARRVISRKGSLHSDYFHAPPPAYLQKFLQRYPYPFPDPKLVSWEDLDAELQAQASINQGSELPGLPNTDLAIQLFQSQAEPWERIAKHHLNKVTITTKAFVDELFTHIMGSPESGNATEAVLRNCVDPFFSEKEEILQQKLQELLRPYVQGYAFPLDADFHLNASQKSRERLTDQLVDAIQSSQPDLFDEKSKQKLNRAMISAAITIKGIDRGEFGTEKVIEMMQSYYEMSRRTFAETVINLAIESCLICDIPNILTPTKVDNMTREKLEKLAVESEDIQFRRNNLQREIDILRHGKELCRELGPRTITARPASDLHGQSALGSSSVTISSTSNGSTPSSSANSASSDQNTATSRPASIFSSKTSQKQSASTLFRFDTPVTTPAPVQSSGSGLFGSSQPAKVPFGSSGSLFRST